MNKHFVQLLRLFLFVLLMCGVSCARANGTEASGEPIKIGAALPFSGGVELYGMQAKLGIDLATKEINAAGGILGRPLQIIYEDDKTRPAGAQEATRKLIESDGVLAVIGPITSQNLFAIKPTIESSKTPLLYATNYEGGACSRYVFSFGPVPNQELSSLLSYMSRSFGNSYYLLGVDRVWPHNMFKVVRPIVSKLGGHLTGEEFVSGQEKDYTPVFERIKASKAKILVFAMKGDGLDNLINQAYNSGLMKSIKIAYLGLSETDLPVVGGKGDNMFVSVPFVASHETKKVKNFVARAKSDAPPGVEVSNYVMTHYNALMAIKAALTKAGKIDQESLIDALEGLQMQTPTGQLTVGKDHHVTMNMFLARTKGKQLVTIKSLGEIRPEPDCK